MQKIYIKNMVCNRCIMVVENIFSGHNIKNINLGEVILSNELSDNAFEDIKNKLKSVGFEVIDDKKSLIIENIKNCIIDLVQNNNSELKVNLSDYITDKLGLDYNHLSTLFSEVEGRTLESYYIAQKIEKVKELLVYDNMTLSEIAFMLNYSSVAHLSNQFKKVTGLTPSFFKSLKDKRRNPVDKI